VVIVLVRREGRFLSVFGVFLVCCETFWMDLGIGLTFFVRCLCIFIDLWVYRWSLARERDMYMT